MGVLQQRSWGRGSAKALGELGLGSLMLGHRGARRSGAEGQQGNRAAGGWGSGDTRAAGH